MQVNLFDNPILAAIGHDSDDFETFHLDGHPDTTEDSDGDNPPDMLPTITLATAQQAVRQRYPSARWAITGDTGRIIAGDVLVSLAFHTGDPDAERFAWLDASGRLGDGSRWSSHHSSRPSGRRVRISPGGGADSWD